MATKRFKGYHLEQPVIIELESPDGERTLTVNCVKSLPGSIFLELASVVQFDMESGGVETNQLAAVAGAAEVLVKVLQMAIVKEEWAAFKAWIDDPENGVGIEMLAEIAGYIASEYTGESPQTSPSS